MKYPDMLAFGNAYDFMIIAIPALLALGGGALASYWNPSRQKRSLIRHVAAGAVLFGEFLVFRGIQLMEKNPKNCRT